MPDESCDCCDTTGGQTAESETDGDRWVDETPITDAALPDDVQTAIGRFHGRESIETLGDWIGALRRRTADGFVAVDDLCHADGRTNHWGVLDGERYYFRCFYDAVALAELVDSPVDVHTETPDGTVVEARATGDGDLDVTPTEAAVSFGIERSAEPPSDDGAALEAAYAAICPSVKAFPDRAAYESWAETAPAATVGLPLEDGVGVAVGLVE